MEPIAIFNKILLSNTGNTGVIQGRVGRGVILPGLGIEEWIAIMTAMIFPRASRKN